MTKPTKIHKTKVFLLDQLNSIKKRLENEAGSYVEMLHVRNQTEPQVGFFSMVRLIMPVIEHIGKVIYGNKSHSKIKLLKELGIEYPVLVWEMYRHSLIHNDEMRQITIGNQTVSWFISLRNADHYYEYYKNKVRNARTGKLLPKPIIIHLDMFTLYDSLHEFLTNQISEVSPTKKVEIETEVVYKKTVKKNKSGKRKKVNVDLQKELNELIKELG